jgi:hypothetical protein
MAIVKIQRDEVYTYVFEGWRLMLILVRAARTFGLRRTAPMFFYVVTCRQFSTLNLTVWYNKI